MSSAAETLNKPETEEPASKKVKLDGDEAAKVDLKSVDNNNGPTADEKAPVTENNNGTPVESDGPASGSANNANQIPTKAANGNNKESKPDEHDASDNEDEAQEAFEDPNITARLREAEGIQSQITQLNEQASEEILLVEQKFNQLRRPYFEKRNALLKDLPNFWVTALYNHPLISSMIQSPEDEDCLHYMYNVDVEELEDIKSGYNLKFYFAENPYIKNDLIVRELRHLDNEEVCSDTTPIDYKDTQQGKKLREVVENSLAQYRRKARDPNNEMHGSFFAWLSQEQENGDPIAEIIKDQIWTNPVHFFLNNLEDFDDDESGSDEEDYDDEEGIEEGLEDGIPDDQLAELQDMEGEEFDDEEEELDDDDDDDDEEDDGEDEE